MAILIWAGSDLPQQFRPFALYLIEALTGGAVGLFVGSLLKKQARWQDARRCPHARRLRVLLRDTRTASQ